MPSVLTCFVLISELIAMLTNVTFKLRNPLITTTRGNAHPQVINSGLHYLGTLSHSLDSCFIFQDPRDFSQSATANDNMKFLCLHGAGTNSRVSSDLYDSLLQVSL